MSRRKQLQPSRLLDTDQETSSHVTLGDGALTSPSSAEEAGDAHVCGKCCAEFLELSDFVAHKKSCDATPMGLYEDTDNASMKDRLADEELDEMPLGDGLLDDIRDTKSPDDTVSEDNYSDIGKTLDNCVEGQEFSEEAVMTSDNENMEDDYLNSCKSDENDESMDMDIGCEEMDKLPSSTPKHNAVTPLLPQMPSMSFSRDSNVKLATLEHTKVAVAQFTENNIAPSEVAVLQNTLLSLQQQQLFQLQLLQQLQNQIMASIGPSLVNVPSQGSATPGAAPTLPPSLPTVSTSNPGSFLLSLPTTSGVSTAQSVAATNTTPAATVALSTSVSATVVKPSDCLSKHRHDIKPPLIKHSSPSFSPGNTDFSGLSMFKKGKPPNVTVGGGMDRSDYAADDPFFKHKCRFCLKVFGSDSALQIHIRSHTVVDTRFSPLLHLTACATSQSDLLTNLDPTRPFLTQSSRPNLQQTTSAPTTTDRGERPFKCNICGNRFSTRGNLKVHFLRHKVKYPHVKMNPHPVPEHLERTEKPAPPILVPAVPPPPGHDIKPEMANSSPPLLRPASELPSNSQDKQLHNSTTDKVLASSHHSDDDSSSVTPPASMVPGMTSSQTEDVKSPKTQSSTPPSTGASPHNEVKPSVTSTPPTFSEAKVGPVTNSPVSSLAPSTRITPIPLPTSLAPSHSNALPPPFCFDTGFPSSILPPQPQEDPMERYMEIQKSETSKLEQLVKNIETKLTDPNQCAICHRILSCKSALQMHYRIHTGERPFKCKICGRCFTTKGNLKTHMGVHRAKPPMRMMHQCPVCHKQFTNSLVLQQHIRMHTGELSKEFSLPSEVMTNVNPYMPFGPFPFLPPGLPVPHPLHNIGGGELDLRTKTPVKREDEPKGSEKNTSEDSAENKAEPGPMADPDDGIAKEVKEAKPANTEQSTPHETSDDGEREGANMSDKFGDESMDTDENPVSENMSHNVDDHIHETPLRRPSSDAPLSARSTPNPSSEKSVSPGLRQTMATPPTSGHHQPITSQAKMPDYSLYNPMSSSSSSMYVSSSAPYVPSTYSTSLMALEERVKAIDSNVTAKFGYARPLEQMENIIRRAEGHHSPVASRAMLPNGERTPNTSPHLHGMPEAVSEGHSSSKEGSLTPSPNGTSPAPSDSNASVESGKALSDPGSMPLSFRSFTALDLSPNSPGRTTTCNVCYKTFACRSALDIHYRSHTRERPFMCEVCDKGFSTKGNMRQHMLTHKIRDLPDEVFGSEAFSREDDDNSMEKPHSVERKSTPPDSRTTVSSQSSTETSDSKSTVSPTSGGGLSPISSGQTSPFVRRPSLRHVCQVCEKPFSSSSALQIHMRTHTGDKPFKCSVCSKAFTTKGNLKVHMGTHMWNNSPSRRGRRMSVDTIPGMPSYQDFGHFAHRSPSEMYPFPFPGYPNGFSPKMNEISVIQNLNGGLGLQATSGANTLLIRPPPGLPEIMMKPNMPPISSSDTLLKTEAMLKAEEALKNKEDAKSENNNNVTPSGKSGELDLSMRKSTTPPEDIGVKLEQRTTSSPSPAWSWKAMQRPTEVAPKTLMT